MKQLENLIDYFYYFIIFYLQTTQYPTPTGNKCKPVLDHHLKKNTKDIIIIIIPQNPPLPPPPLFIYFITPTNPLEWTSKGGGVSRTDHWDTSFSEGEIEGQREGPPSFTFWTFIILYFILLLFFDGDQTHGVIHPGHAPPPHDLMPCLWGSKSTTSWLRQWQQSCHMDQQRDGWTDM